jgi:predicted DNA binding CopG/RHH family protein
MAKNHEIRLKVSKEELERLQQKAKAFGVPLATFIRLVALRSEVIVK